ncbi:MAG: OmpA family protein, partial [Bacteroidota bacterium]
LGPTINSNDWDTYYSISAKGDYAYIVSTKGAFGNEDVLEIKLSEEARPDPVVLIYGNVYNKKTKKPIGVDIVYENLKTGAKVGTARSNPRTGSYKIILPYGKEYGFRAVEKSYMAINEQIDLRKISKYQEQKRILYLVPIETGSVINLQNVQFKRSKAEFTETSYAELDRLVALMKKYPKMEIELAGHTDTRGKANLLMALSQQRVAAVKNFLIKNGINRNRISGKGYGGTKPQATGSDELEIKNRRVEFKIVKM